MNPYNTFFRFGISFLFFHSILFTSSFSQSVIPPGVWNWTTIAGDADDDQGVDIVVDAVGNTYVTGRYSANLNWGSYSLTSNGLDDIFLAKLNSGGAIQWLTSAGSSSHDYPEAIVLHPNGNVFICGFYGGGAQFGGQVLTSNGNRDAFVAEYDPVGNLVQVFTGGGPGDDAFLAMEVDENGNIVVGGYMVNGSSGATFDTLLVNPYPGNMTLLPMVASYSPQGSIQWLNHGLVVNTPVPTGSWSGVRGLTVDSSGSIYACGGFQGVYHLGTDSLVSQGNGSFFVSKIDANGQEQWLRGGGGTGNYRDHLNDIVITPQGDVQALGFLNEGYGHVDGIAIGTQSLPDAPEILLLTYDTLGNYSDHFFFGSGEEDWPTKLAYDQNSNLFVSGGYYADIYFGSDLVLDHLAVVDGFLIKIAPNGTGLMANTIGGFYDDPVNSFAIGQNGNIYVTGYAEDMFTFGEPGAPGSIPATGLGAYDIFVANIWDTTFLPVGNNLITGQIYVDVDQDCMEDVGEQVFINQLVRVEPGPYWGMTDSSGRYEIVLDTGTFQINQQFNSLQSQFISSLCPTNPPTYSVSFSAQQDTIDELDFANQVDSCHLLAVDVASSARRLCFSNLTVISYQNLGFIDVPNAFIHLTLPSEVVLLQADSAYQLLPDSTYLFPLGDVPPGFQGEITIIDSVLCGDPVRLIGLSQCTEVWATPIGTCIAPDSSWSGADLQVFGVCRYGMGIFQIVNTGIGNMTDSVEYRVIRDSLLILQAQVKLDAGDTLSFQVGSNGLFVRVEVDQVLNHPTSTQVSADLDGCYIPSGPAGSSPSGLSIAYSQSEQPPEISVDCMVITGAYDPNDKLASPMGLTAQHIVPTQTSIDYRIRFQNTGTDTAFTVVIVDTLSSSFDPASLLIGAASHPYRYSISGLGNPVLTVTFDNILLPDSNVNLLASQGFISYKISPYDSLAQGTVVENKADIYFDFNPPIRTNTTMHTFLDTSFFSTDPSAISDCDGLPSTAVAGEDSSYCELETIQLMATPPSSGIGYWQQLSENGSIDDVYQSDANISGLSYGVTELAWIIQLCEQATMDTLRLERFEQPAQALISVLGTDSLTSNMIADSYHWYLDGMLLPDSSASILPSQSGMYSLQLINGPCLSDLSDPFLFTLTSISDMRQNVLDLYPNPSTGIFLGKWTQALKSEQMLTLIDSRGRICAEKRLRSGLDDLSFSWNLSHLPSGIYVVKIGDSQRMKIVISN